MVGRTAVIGEVNGGVLTAPTRCFPCFDDPPPEEVATGAGFAVITDVPTDFEGGVCGVGTDAVSGADSLPEDTGVLAVLPVPLPVWAGRSGGSCRAGSPLVGDITPVAPGCGMELKAGALPEPPV